MTDTNDQGITVPRRVSTPVAAGLVRTELWSGHSPIPHSERYECEHGINVAAACADCHARDSAAHPEWNAPADAPGPQQMMAAVALVRRINPLIAAPPNADEARAQLDDVLAPTLARIQVAAAKRSHQGICERLGHPFDYVVKRDGYTAWTECRYCDTVVSHGVSTGTDWYDTSHDPQGHWRGVNATAEQNHARTVAQDACGELGHRHDLTRTDTHDGADYQCSRCEGHVETEYHPNSWLHKLDGSYIPAPTGIVIPPVKQGIGDVEQTAGLTLADQLSQVKALYERLCNSAPNKIRVQILRAHLAELLPIIDSLLTDPPTGG